MNAERKKQLIAEYKHRKPEMGIISYRCTVTGDTFLGISKDIKAGFNSTNVKLNTSWHPNKELQGLWNEYGEEKFEYTVAALLSYEDAGEKEDYSTELEEMLLEHLERDPQAKRLWK